jgi:hypothetical protein
VLLSGKTLDTPARSARMSARELAIWGALAVAVVNGLVGCFGALRWYQVAPSRRFWFGVRAGQALALAYALLVAVALLGHQRPASSLYYLYALLPIAVGFVAEQLRLVAADQVLTARDLDDAQAVATLPAPEQQAIVTAILRREMGVMALAALVVCVLALRAAGTY